MQQFEIKSNEAGQRLDKFLHKYMKEAPNSFLYKMLRKKNITLNRKKADGKELLQEGDVIQFFFSEETFAKFRGEGFYTEYQKAFQTLKDIQVIFENDHIVLLNKPAGVLSQKSAPADLSLNEWLIGYLLENGSISAEQLKTYKPSICNRLDRNTSGLVICGKSLPGSQKMNQLIQERKIRKFYRTFVKGQIKEPAYVKGYLKKDEKSNKVIFKENIKPNETDFWPVETGYRPVSYGRNYTYLEVELVTGKTHQIRAHLSGNGHPLLGDTKYGDRNWNQSFWEYQLPSWQLLHSYRIELPELEAPFEDLSGQVFIAEEPAVFEKLK